MRFDGGVAGADADTDASTWTVVVPVKRLSAAKSRMGAAGVPALDDLAMAFFQDTTAAALSCSIVARVVVATTDERVAGWALDMGCSVFDDRHHPGINAAAEAAGASVGGTIAVLVSDLPCATAQALEFSLRLARAHPQAFLADAAGTGTTLWTSTATGAAHPRFGEGSRAAHRAAGAVDLVELAASHASLERMRRDVDTPSDLVDALRIGVGPHTAAAVTGARPA
jgi:2-phospho-L-lactate guanylyltransferase